MGSQLLSLITFPQSIDIPLSLFLLCFQAPMVLLEEPDLEAPTAAHL